MQRSWKQTVWQQSPHFRVWGRRTTTNPRLSWAVKPCPQKVKKKNQTKQTKTNEKLSVFTWMCGCVQSWLFHSLLIQSETNGLNPQVLVLVLLCLHTVGKHSYHWGITSPEPQFWLLQNGHERYNSVVECLPSSLRHWVQFPKPGNRKDRRGPWLIVSLSVADKAINDSPQLKVTKHDFLTLWQCKRKTHSEKTKQNNKKKYFEFWVLICSQAIQHFLEGSNSQPRLLLSPVIMTLNGRYPTVCCC